MAADYEFKSVAATGMEAVVTGMAVVADTGTETEMMILMTIPRRTTSRKPE